MAKRKTVPKEISLSSLLGEKLKDIGSDEEGWTLFYFSNNLRLKLKGNVFMVLEVKEVEG